MPGKARRSTRDRLQCRESGSANIKTCGVHKCDKQVQRNSDGEWILCRRHSIKRHAPTTKSVASARIRPTCQGFTGDVDGSRCSKQAQYHAGMNLMCHKHTQQASTLLPKKLIVISIDQQRYDACKHQINKYHDTMFKDVKGPPEVISQNGEELLRNGGLQREMNKWHDEWKFDPQILTCGQVGCSLGHMKALRAAADGNDVVTIVEDDILVDVSASVDNLKTVMVANTVPGGWGLLRVGQHQTAQASEFKSRQLTKRTKLVWGCIRWGTYFYLTTPQAAAATLEALNSNKHLYNQPCDIWMSDAAVSDAANIKDIHPALVKYRTDVVSKTGSA